VDLLAVRATAEAIARRAGAALLEHYDRPHQHQIKKSYNDLVTEGDMASQAVVVPALREAFPDHHIVSEEGGDSGTPADQADYFWYIDPLDGTSNFASNLPLFSVSIGMADKHLRPLVGNTCVRWLAWSMTPWVTNFSAPPKGAAQLVTVNRSRFPRLIPSLNPCCAAAFPINTPRSMTIICASGMPSTVSRAASGDWAPLRWNCAMSPRGASMAFGNSMSIPGMLWPES